MLYNDILRFKICCIPIYSLLGVPGSVYFLLEPLIEPDSRIVMAGLLDAISILLFQKGVKR